MRFFRQSLGSKNQRSFMTTTQFFYDPFRGGFRFTCKLIIMRLDQQVLTYSKKKIPARTLTRSPFAGRFVSMSLLLPSSLGFIRVISKDFSQIPENDSTIVMSQRKRDLRASQLIYSF